MKLVDVGCGNGNLIYSHLNRSFSAWLGIDGGTAVLDTAKYLEKRDRRVTFVCADLCKKVPALWQEGDFHHATSVFVLEEIPPEGVKNYFANMAAAVSKRCGAIHIVTQHPSYIFLQDWIAFSSGEENGKFPGQQGYFDTSRTQYTLSDMNRKKGYAQKIGYYHKPMGHILTTLAEVGLTLREMIEVPSGISRLDELEAHAPKSGDVPRFLYIQARNLSGGMPSL